MAKAKDNAEVVASVHVEDIDGRGTARTTQTIVEDRTEAPEERPVVEYEAVHAADIDKHGTTLTTYMEPVGGFVGEVSE